MPQIVVISSLNTQSGKTLLTAHFGVMLARTYRTAVSDTVSGQSPLSMFVAARFAYNLNHTNALPVPNYISANKDFFDTSAENYDVVLLDAPDLSCWPLADILITPLGTAEERASFCRPDNPYATLVWQAKKTRAAQGKNAFRWIVVPTGPLSDGESADLEKAGKKIGFSVAPTLLKRAEYDCGLKSGLTVWDKDLPSLNTLFDMHDLYARRELKKIAEFIWRKS